MEKTLVTLLITAFALTGCASRNADGLTEKEQQRVNTAGEKFSQKSVPAYVALFPDHLDTKYKNTNNTLNSQAVINDFSKNWNTYYSGQADFINAILNIHEEHDKEYRNKAKREIAQTDMNKDIPEKYIYEACGENEFVRQSSDQQLSFYQCVFLNEMLNADRKILVSQVNNVSPEVRQRIIDQSRDLAAKPYLEMVKRSFSTQKWYQTPLQPIQPFFKNNDLIIR